LILICKLNLSIRPSVIPIVGAIFRPKPKAVAEAALIPTNKFQLAFNEIVADF
jgi:citrate lyase beta subunit